MAFARISSPQLESWLQALRVFERRDCLICAIAKNAHRDAVGYDCYGYTHGRLSPIEEQRDLFPASPLEDANAYYRGFRRAQKGSAWKEAVQHYEMDFLSNIAAQRREIMERRYIRKPCTVFTMSERGKTRVITGEHIADRVLKHVLCDDILLPAILPKLIHDNGASIQGKGVDFTRRRLVQHLSAYYRKYGNEGYILLMDFSKFYDNIRHKELRRILLEHVHDPHAEYLIDCILQNERVDVSYMTPEQYAVCMDTVFNSIEYQEIPTQLKTGRLWMDKHLDIGDQLAQVAGIAYPSGLDNYIKIVRGVKFYARYMDDSYILHPDKAYLQRLQKDVTQRAAEIGITVNQSKTRIVPISGKWRFLQTQYSLTSTGRIIRKASPTAVARCRRKMKKLQPILTPQQFEEWFKCWINGNGQYLSKQQRKNLYKLFHTLEEKQCTQ